MQQGIQVGTVWSGRFFFGNWATVGAGVERYYTTKCDLRFTSTKQSAREYRAVQRYNILDAVQSKLENRLVRQYTQFQTYAYTTSFPPPRDHNIGFRSSATWNGASVFALTSSTVTPSAISISISPLVKSTSKTHCP